MSDVLPTEENEHEYEVNDSKVIEEADCEQTLDGIQDLENTFAQSPLKISKGESQLPSYRQKAWPLLPPLFKFFYSFKYTNFKKVDSRSSENILEKLLDYFTLNDYLKIRNLNSRTRFADEKDNFFFGFHDEIQQYLVRVGAGMTNGLRSHLW